VSPSPNPNKAMKHGRVIVVASIKLRGEANEAGCARTRPDLPQDVPGAADRRQRHKLYVRVGGGGPAVVLLHGYGGTGDMWVPLANDLGRDHTVVIPTCAAWGSPPSSPVATTRKRKPVTLQVSSMRSKSSELPSSLTTLATWSVTPSPRSTACQESCHRFLSTSPAAIPAVVECPLFSGIKRTSD